MKQGEPKVARELLDIFRVFAKEERVCRRIENRGYRVWGTRHPSTVE